MQSYLQKAGVRFNINVVDTMCKKGFGLSFYIFCLLFILLSVIYFTDNICIFPDKGHFYFLSLLVALYLALYIIRVVRFRILRSKLREDNAPIVVEAYAIVLFDLSSHNCEKIVKPKKSAILYKECGSKKPRFFTGVVKLSITTTKIRLQEFLLIENTLASILLMMTSSIRQSLRNFKKNRLSMRSLP